VSQGQSYALLLAAATNDREKFAAAYDWEEDNLALPSGLFAYQWSGGSAAGQQPATDADLATAWALVLAGREFRDPAYTGAAKRLASDILANETVTVAGQVELVAGPWARSTPPILDPSYLITEAMAALRAATGDREWSTLESHSKALLSRLSSSGQLPPDWATVQADGSVQPTGAPAGGVPTQYGLDAQRVLLWEAASCDNAQRRVAAREWPILERSAENGGDLSYSLSGISTSSYVNPLGFMAAAAAAAAEGRATTAKQLMQRADRQATTTPTYYGDAWVALGSFLLTSNALRSCPPLGGD
jgi:endoglucanase